MFLGQYTHSLDSKYRLTVPARFRENLGSGVYVTMGFDKNLMVLTEAGFNAMFQNLQEKSITDPRTRGIRRLLFANADFLEFDSAGRIIINKLLRDMVGITTEVILVGQYDYIEVWAPEEWTKQIEQMQDEANAERYAALDLATRHVTPTSTLQ